MDHVRGKKKADRIYIRETNDLKVLNCRRIACLNSRKIKLRNLQSSQINEGISEDLSNHGSNVSYVSITDREGGDENMVTTIRGCPKLLLLDTYRHYDM